MFSSTSMQDEFSGARVLLVEDNFLVGLGLRRQLERLGCDVVGPLASVDETLSRLATEQPIDCAVLDVNLRGGTSVPLAERFHGAGTPFFFITGYQSPIHLSDRLASVDRIMKPVEQHTLRTALGAAMQDR